MPGSWALFAASLIATGIGLKARFFYIFPTWVFTLPCALYTTYNFWETTVSFLKIALLFFIVLIVFIILVIYIQEKSKLRNLYLGVIDIPDKNNGTELYWKGLKSLFFFPLFGKWSVAVYEYNIGVLQQLKDNGIELRFSEEFQNEMVKGKNSLLTREAQSFDPKVKDHFFAEIDHQIKTWQGS